MSPSKVMRTLAFGLVLSTPAAFAQGKSGASQVNHKLTCPAGTKQFGNADDGIYCRRTEASGGVYTPHGPYVSYYPNGQKRSEGQYADGFRTGQWVFYNEAGQQTGQTEFKRDNYHGKRVQNHANGKPRIVEEYTDGKLNGLVQEFSEDGKVVRQMQYRDNQLVDAK